MFDNHDFALLEFVLNMIDEAQKVAIKYANPHDALMNFESKNSILLNLLQIGEKLTKIKSEDIRKLLPIKETYSIRNRITHDYSAVDLEIVEDIISYELEELKSTIQKIINS